MKYPIFIPSRGRSKTTTTAKFLMDAGLPFKFVVEPKEEKVYTEACEKLWKTASLFVLPESDKGIGYSRNNIHKYARDVLKVDKYWMMDDNIRRLLKRTKDETSSIGQKMKTVDAKEPMEYLENLSDTFNNLAVSSFEFQQYSVRSNQPWRLNRRCCCSMLIDTRIGWGFEEDAKLKEDVIFCLQCWSNGWKTLILQEYAMEKNVMGTTKVGGLSEIYKDVKLVNAISWKIVNRFPKLAKLVKKDRWVDIGLNTKAIDELIARFDARRKG